MCRVTDLKLLGAVISESEIFLVSISRLSMQTGLRRETKPNHETKLIKKNNGKNCVSKTPVF